MALAVRWTIGDVSTPGFQALQLSLLCATRLFGPGVRYRVCVNTLGVDEARARTGPVPQSVEWISNAGSLPHWLAERFDEGMGEGVGWKLAPPQLFLTDHELSLDNDVILWTMPRALEEWLAQESRCLIAADVERCLGRFDPLCPPGAFNSGIRGVPPGFAFDHALQRALHQADTAQAQPVQLTSELDEQGLQVAAVSLHAPPFVVTTDEVSICSPFWPKRPELGRCGAHFVGLNARHLPWNYFDRTADAWMEEHWAHHLPTLSSRAAGLASG